MKPKKLYQKGDYQAKLKTRASEVLEQFDQAADRDEELSVIFQALEKTGKESFSNGVKTGLREARQKSTDSTQSA